MKVGKSTICVLVSFVGVCVYTSEAVTSCLKTVNIGKCNQYFINTTRKCYYQNTVTPCGDWHVSSDDAFTVQTPAQGEVGRTGIRDKITHAIINVRECEVNSQGQQTGTCLNRGQQNFTCNGEEANPETGECSHLP